MSSGTSLQGWVPLGIFVREKKCRGTGNAAGSAIRAQAANILMRFAEDLAKRRRFVPRKVTIQSCLSLSWYSCKNGKNEPFPL